MGNRKLTKRENAKSLRTRLGPSQSPAKSQNGKSQTHKTRKREITKREIANSQNGKSQTHKTRKRELTKREIANPQITENAARTFPVACEITENAARTFPVAWEIAKSENAARTLPSRLGNRKTRKGFQDRLGPFPVACENANCKWISDQIDGFGCISTHIRRLRWDPTSPNQGGNAVQLDRGLCPFVPCQSSKTNSDSEAPRVQTEARGRRKRGRLVQIGRLGAPELWDAEVYNAIEQCKWTPTPVLIFLLI